METNLSSPQNRQLDSYSSSIWQLTKHIRKFDLKEFGDLQVHLD